MLLRLIDDYLFITTDLQDAREFLEIMDKGMEPTLALAISICVNVNLSVSMLSGHPEYGCFISRDKILINFEHELSANLRPDQTCQLHAFSLALPDMS